MGSTEKVISLYADHAAPDYEGKTYAGVNVWSRGRSIYSYGTHFELARAMPDSAGNPRGWFLVNSDTYSITTSRHQGDVRSALKRTGLPVILLPFSALRAAGIDMEAISPVEIRPDRYDRIRHHGRQDDIPVNGESVTRHDDGTADWTTETHVMGDSVFTAACRMLNEHAGVTTVNATFLSSTDPQEDRRHGYFLCQLPDDREGVTTVTGALATLWPPAVRSAFLAGRTDVVRQGDVFAIPSPHLRTTGPTQRSARVLGTSHVATEVRIQAGGETFARGWLRHRPVTDWGTSRPSQHRARKLGDGKTWHRILRNTVTPGRSWQAEGSVD